MCWELGFDCTHTHVHACQTFFLLCGLGGGFDFVYVHEYARINKQQKTDAQSNLRCWYYHSEVPDEKSYEKMWGSLDTIDVKDFINEVLRSAFDLVYCATLKKNPWHIELQANNIF